MAQCIRKIDADAGGDWGWIERKTWPRHSRSRSIFRPVASAHVSARSEFYILKVEETRRRHPSFRQRRPEIERNSSRKKPRGTGTLPRRRRQTALHQKVLDSSSSANCFICASPLELQERRVKPPVLLMVRPIEKSPLLEAPSAALVIRLGSPRICQTGSM